MSLTEQLLEKQPVRERRISRFLAFGAAVVLVISTLTTRLFYMQINQGEHFAGIAQSQQVVTEPIPSSRGLIYDRNGVALVTNVPSFSVKIRPADLPFSERPAVVSRLATLLKMDPTQINMAIDSNPGSRFDLVRIAQDVPEATARLISEENLVLPGVEVVVEARRQYTYGPLMSDVLGYTGPINAQQLQQLASKGYQPDDLIGEAGVELQYEQQLRGVYGAQTVERDATGRQIQVLSTVSQPQAGDSLVLTIDTRDQQYAQQALSWAMQASGSKLGALIVMDPQTGEILAMASNPTYDDNLFSHGISQADFQKLLTNPYQPLINHALASQYPPGSTYKLVAATGALTDHKLTTETTLQTYPYLSIGPFRYYDWNHRGFGRINILSGFAFSSDTFFYQVSAMLGIDRLAYWAHQYGFGQPTGVDLPNEASGTVPSNQWKMDTLGQPIYQGEVYQAGIGQGYDEATPLQLLNAYCALANGGNLYQPQIVREILGPNGNVVRSFKPILIRKLPVPASVLTTMREAARKVVTSRMTYNLVDLPLVVAGKTGTAEFGLPDKNGHLPFHHWFVGFVPKNGDVSKPDSQLAVVGFIYNVPALGNPATEMVKYFLQLHYGIKQDYRNFYLMKPG